MADPAAALLVGALLGLVLGLLGGGGGVLAVPLFVAAGLPVLTAGSASLVVVGVGAGAALVPQARAGRVRWRTGLVFGGLGFVGAVVGARAATVVNPEVQLAGFIVLLVAAAAAMFRSARVALEGRRGDAGARGPAPAPVPASPAKVVLLATAVGAVTGFFGVGGGFVVVPALVAAVGLPMTQAAATGLVVIVINSAVALVARHGHLPPVGPLLLLAGAAALAAVGGALLSRKVPAWTLSAGFGALILVVAGLTAVHLGAA